VVVGKRQSRPWIVSDELWSLIEPLLPEPGPKQVEGQPRAPDRQALCGILFVLHTGIQWEPRRLRFRLLSAAAQIVTTARRRYLRFARHWPWTGVITDA
jgi:transposase